MIVLEAGQTLRGIAGTASVISCTVDGMELASGAETYKTLAQAQLGATVGTIYTVPAATQAFVKSIHLVNTSASAVTGVKLFVGGAVAANQITGSFTLPPNGWAVFEENGWNVYDAAGEQMQRVTSSVNLSGVATFNLPYQSGNFYCPPGMTMRESTGAAVPIVNRAILTPFMADRNFTMKSIGCVVTTPVAASNVQFAVYASDPVTGIPLGNPLATTANASAAAATDVTQLLSTPVQIVAGKIYYLAINFSAASIGFTACGPNSAFASQIGQAIALNVIANASMATAFTFNQTFGTWPSATGQSLNITLSGGTPFLFYQVN